MVAIYPKEAHEVRVRAATVSTEHTEHISTNLVFSGSFYSTFCPTVVPSLFRHKTANDYLPCVALLRLQQYNWRRPPEHDVENPTTHAKNLSMMFYYGSNATYIKIHPM